MMVSDYDTPQFVSITKDVCTQEDYLKEEPCSLIHNGSPAGGAPTEKLPHCGE